MCKGGDLSLVRYHKKQPSLVAKLQQAMARARIGITLEHRTLMRRYTEKGIMIMKSLMKPLKNSLHSCCFMPRAHDVWCVSHRSTFIASSLEDNSSFA